MEGIGWRWRELSRRLRRVLGASSERLKGNAPGAQEGEDAHSEDHKGYAD